MDASRFDEHDPWHAYVHLLFSLDCSRCSASMGYPEVPIGDFGDHFLEFCVAIADRAKTDGWVCIGDLNFLCPACAKASPLPHGTKAYRRFLRAVAAGKLSRIRAWFGRRFNH